MVLQGKPDPVFIMHNTEKNASYSQFFVSTGSVLTDPTDCGPKLLGKNCICIEHGQTFFLSLFPKQFNITTIYIALHCIWYYE
jgi:hypothetical protein